MGSGAETKEAMALLFNNCLDNFFKRCTTEEIESIMAIESMLGVKDMQPADVVHVQFKRRKMTNVRYKDFINSSGKQFKVNDLAPKCSHGISP